MSLESRAASTSEPIGYWALLRENARYRRLWTGLVVSMAGDWFRTIALYHLVLHLTGASGLALSGVVLAQTLSLFLLSPVAGVVADRFSRKAIMIGADLVRAGLALGFLLVTSADRVWLAYVLTAALMGVAAFFNPAHAATIPNIVTRRELVAANALTSASWAAMLAIGAALGGVVAAVFGIGAAFVINAVAYVVSAWCISTVPIPPTPTAEKSSTDRSHNGWQDFWHGLRYMRYTSERPPPLIGESLECWRRRWPAHSFRAVCRASVSGRRHGYGHSLYDSRPRRHARPPPGPAFCWRNPGSDGTYDQRGLFHLSELSPGIRLYANAVARRCGPVPGHHGGERPVGVQLDPAATERARRVSRTRIRDRFCPVHYRYVRLYVHDGLEP